jgi:hypothetical protein
MSIEKKPKGIGVGFGIIIGAAIGTLFFALTSQTVLIAIGAGLGVVFGAILESLSSQEFPS